MATRPPRRRMSPASMSRAHSASVKSPERSLVPSTKASLASRREASCSRPISRDKKAPRRLAVTATWRAMFSPKLVLPTPGRAASTIKSERFRPVMVLSSSLMPVGRPLYLSRSAELSLSSLSKVSSRISRTGCRPSSLLPRRMS